MHMKEVGQAWLDDLNPPQRVAVTHGDGPLLIVAGAGSGKTRTLAYRVSYLLSRGVQPERVLLLTFTRRAAEEMLKRAAAVAPPGVQAHRVWGGTFHAVANRILRSHAQALGLSPDFTILDRSDAEDLLDVVRTELGMAATNRRFPRKSTCMDIYSRRVNGDDDLASVLRHSFPWCLEWESELKTLFRQYVDRKAERYLLDYDDLLLYWHHLVQDEDAGGFIGAAFDHILVDEYQDTNRVQAGILRGMRRTNGNITVVGDDAQSVYSFRSATVENMLEFPGQFSGTTVVTLDQNYRSVQPILETTNRLIAQASHRYSKELWSARTSGQRPQVLTCADEPQQDEAVIQRVLEHYEQGVPLRRQAVLFRASSLSASLELALARRNIPFRKYGGLRFLEAAHVKDLIGFLRVVLNPRDEVAWFRVLQLLPGVGPATARAAFDHVAEQGYEIGAIGAFSGPPSARDALSELGRLLEMLCRSEGLAPESQIDSVRRYYEPLLERLYENPQARLADLAQLAQLAGRHESLESFLSDLVLDPPAVTGDLAGPPMLDEDWLNLSTIHSAKGLEWDAVFLIHASDGCLPSDMTTGSPEEIEEELRLAYVAMTRARDFLYVLWPLRYFHRPAGVSDRHGYAQRSRFLSEEVVAIMDTLSLSTPGYARQVALGNVTASQVAARIRSMWD